jgi:predicted nucleic acid-binding protein
VSVLPTAVLIDTSVWVDHFRSANTALSELLVDGVVIVHPFVLGEIAMGNLKRREAVLAGLEALARPVVAADEEVLRLVADRKLNGRGIGWIDAHLLASVLLTGCWLWTRDLRLNAAAEVAGFRLFK